MEDKSPKNEQEKKGKEYLSQSVDLPSIEDMFTEAVSDGLKGIGASQSSEAINLDENEIKDIKKKKEEENELTSNEQQKLSIHDIQSGKFKQFFGLVDQDLTNKSYLNKIKDEVNKTDDQNEKEQQNEQLE